jgi:glycerol transport system substrate-binding protein
VVSETIDTHVYESKTMAKAFEEITGIKVKHDLIQEGDVIEKLQTQMQSGRNIYDMYVNDSDLIGTHVRYGHVVPLSDFMAGEGKDVTLPTLDLNDFMGKSFVTGPDGKMYQLPDQQFANLYWFRQDWFSRPDLKERFKKKYGYELGVPVNWSAYEDIAEFFTNDVKQLMASGCTATWTTGRRTRRSGGASRTRGCPWRRGRQGLPQWQAGGRVGHPRRGLPPGGRLGGARRRGERPAAVYALTKYIDWLKKYAPPEAAGMTFSEAGPCRARATWRSRSSGTRPSPRR